MLGEALGLSPASISVWESVSNPAVPPAGHLRTYAAIFATPRSVQGRVIRPIPPADLTPEEARRYGELERELLELHRAATGQRSASGPRAAAAVDPWEFADGGAVTIVCGGLSAKLRERMPYTDPDDPDYTDLYSWADPDSLVELYGHIREHNPGSTVNYRRSGHLASDDYASHLVLLGGPDFNDETRKVLRRMPMPVTLESSRATEEGPYYEVPGAGRHHPVLIEEGSVLLEDVACFYRGPNPYSPDRTLTICAGIYGRGTFGIVRALTDPSRRQGNARFLAERFAGQPAFGLLSRVLVEDNRTLTPDWTRPEFRLHEWPG
ncbi:hypothetical protein [Nonomuraea sp. NPDC050310]|uniref:hypothetical protein n=1 Tax=unclassified Nonomuraea TaxID=2593643 RepID=UPI0033F81C9A